MTGAIWDGSQLFIFALVCAPVHVNIDVETVRIYSSSHMMALSCRTGIRL